MKESSYTENNNVFIINWVFNSKLVEKEVVKMDRVDIICT